MPLLTPLGDTSLLMPGHICSLNTPLLSQVDKFRVSRLRWHGTPRAGVPGSRRGSARKSYRRPLPAPAGVRYGAVVAECHFSPSLTWHKSTRTWQAEVVTNMLQKNGGLTYFSSDPETVISRHRGTERVAVRTHHAFPMIPV